MTRSGGFDESFHQLVDWDLSLRLSDAAAVAAVDEPLVAYTQHAGNMATTSAKSLLPEWRRLRRKHRALARRRGGRLRSDYVLPWYVWRLQLGGRRWRAATIGTVWGARLRNAELARAAVSGLRAGTPPPPAYRGVRSRSHPRQASRSGERPWLPSPSDTLPWLHAAEAGPAATQDQATGRRSSELIDSAEMQPDFAETQEHQRRREASWARAARQIERSRSWRAGSFLVGTFRLLTSRRPASPRGPAELAASIEEHIHFANAQPAVPETQEHQRRREASWARAARQIERSRTWRVGSFLVGAFRLLTFRRPALPQGPAELAASIESFTLEPPRNGCR